VPRLRLISGSPPPDTPKERVRKRLRAGRRPEHIARCHRCTGVELKEVRIGMTKRNGKLTGGTKQWICAACERNGERVVVA
jgi:hypothetical protein